MIGNGKVGFWIQGQAIDRLCQQNPTEIQELDSDNDDNTFYICRGNFNKIDLPLYKKEELIMAITFFRSNNVISRTFPSIKKNSKKRK